jgi:hypothetical protein
MKTVTPEYLAPNQVAVMTSTNRSWVFSRLKEYKETNGRYGLGPQYRPPGIGGRPGRKVLVKREDVMKYMARFRAP